MQSDPHLFNLCANLRRLRQKHGLSKREMAAILGVGVRTLTLLERGVLPPRLGCSVLIRASRYFHVTADGLFTPIEE